MGLVTSETIKPKDQWTSYAEFTRFRALIAYVFGMLEFRASATTYFEDLLLREWYDRGRERMHRITKRRYEPDEHTIL